MRKLAYVGCVVLLSATVSCSSTAEVGSVVYRAKCETEKRWLGRQCHWTAAEAKADLALHQREHPTHHVTFYSSKPPRFGQLPTDPSEK